MNQAYVVFALVRGRTTGQPVAVFLDLNAAGDFLMGKAKESAAAPNQEFDANSYFIVPVDMP